MLDDASRTAALSSLVLQLHRGCRSWPAAAFQDRACELLADVLPLDAVVWGTENPKTLRPLALHGFQVPHGLWADYLTQGASADPLLAAARAAAGDAVAMSFADAEPGPAPDGQAAGGPCFLLGHGIAQGLAVAQIEPLSALRSFVCVWRGAGSGPFSADDRRLLQFLMPHLVETTRESQLSRALAGPEATPAARSHAVCDRTGVMLHLDDRCQALLRLEWPQWPGGSLPEALQQAVLQGEGQPAFVGRRIVVRLVAQGETLLLAVRLRAAQDRLSARQRGIAELYASGCTGTEIATRLGLSASTVNNHLGDIFKKLQVSNKLQLARALQGRDG